ncbi:MAG: EAL domain-containing protein [Hydrogenoanaerobacterium sp.]
MKHKKIVTALLCFVLCVTLCLPAFSAKNDTKFNFRVGYCLGYGVFDDDSGNIYGYVYDYMHNIADINGWNIEFIPCEWSEGMDKLERGEIDVFGGMQKTPAREATYDFPKHDMGTEYGSVFMRYDNSEVFYDDLKSIDGKTVGITSGNYYHVKLLQYCTENNITLNFKIIDDADELDKALENGEIDLRVSGSMFAPKNTKVVLQFCADEFYFPTTKGNTYVLEGLNKALDKIRRSDVYYSAHLYDKYYKKAAIGNVAFTQAEKNYIQNAPVLNVGYEIDGAPVEFYDNSENAPRGITIELLEKISQYSGLKFNYVKTDSYSEVLQKTQSAYLDFSSGFIGDEDFMNKYGLVTTMPILETKLVFISKQGKSVNTKEAKMALPGDWAGVKNQLEKDYIIKEIVYYKTYEECLDAVVNGKADIAVLNTYAADQALKPYKYNSLSVTNMAKSDMIVYLAAPKNSPKELISILNKSIGSLSSDVIDAAIYKYTVGVPYQISFSDSLRYNSPFIMMSIIVLFGVIYYLMYRARKKLDRLAFVDELTGEMNLSKFKLEAQKLLQHGKSSRFVMVLDIDNFKLVNDLYGYDFGDEILCDLARIIKLSLTPDALLCRGTADKFYVFEKDFGEQNFCERFKAFSQRIDNLKIEKFPNCKITISAGVCVVRSEDSNIVSVIDRANIASKTHKTNHNNSYTYYNQSMYDKLSAEKEIEDRMKYAVENKEFLVYLQPKIELLSTRVVGAEALVRWQYPGKGLVPPNDFIPLFERNGFVINIDYYVFEEVCRLLKRWSDEGREMIVISVNLSRRHLENENTAKILNEIIEKYGVPQKYIEIELTESAFVDCDINVIKNFLNEFHKYGFVVSVDDFGAGYSSLSLLKDLPVDVIKIDKAFFDNQENHKSEVILESIINLSHKLSIKTVSEGVETELQIILLQGLGCDLVQGYYFAKPMPVLQIEDYIINKNKK